MIIKWQKGSYAQQQGYFGLGLWLSQLAGVTIAVAEVALIEFTLLARWDNFILTGRDDAFELDRRLDNFDISSREDSFEVDDRKDNFTVRSR